MIVVTLQMESRGDSGPLGDTCSPANPYPLSAGLDSALLQVSVNLSPSSIRVAVQDDGGEHVLMEGTFTHKINTESSLWSLEPGKCVSVSVA